MTPKAIALAFFATYFWRTAAVESRSVAPRLHWFEAGTFKHNCPGFESPYARMSPVDALPVKVLALGPDKFVAFGYGSSCSQDLQPRTDWYHDLDCTRARSSNRLLSAVMTSDDAGSTFRCTLSPGAARYHASYGTVGEPGACHAVCIVSGQVPDVASDGVVGNITLSTNVSCFTAAGQPGPVAPPLPFAVLRATIVHYEGYLMILGGLRPAGAPAGPLALQFDPLGCAFVGSWSVVPGIAAALATDGRIDLWSVVVDGKSARALTGSSTAIAALVVGGGYAIPPMASVDLLGFRYAPYYGVEGNRYEQVDIFYAQGPVKTGSCGGPDCFTFKYLQRDTNFPLKRASQMVNAAVVYPTGFANQLLPSPSDFSAQLLATSEGSIFMSNALNDTRWTTVAHVWWFSSFFEPFVTDAAPGSDHCIFNTLTIPAGAPKEPLLWCIASDARGPVIWRGFARQCSSCGFGTYQSAPCVSSPLENPCRTCGKCNRDLSVGPLQYEFDSCQTGLNTLCQACTVCQNGTLQECGETEDAVCLPPPVPRPVLNLIKVSIGSAETYGIAMASVFLPALLALLASMVVLREAAHAKAAQRGASVESFWLTFKRSVRKVRVFALPAAAIVSYASFDLGAAAAARTPGLDAATASFLVTIALLGCMSCVLAVLLNIFDFAVWLSFTSKFRIPEVPAQPGARSSRHSGAACALVVLSWAHTYMLHHVRRSMVSAPSPELLLRVLAAFPCCAPRTGGRVTDEDAGKEPPGAASSWRDSPSSVTCAMKIAMLYSCLLVDGMHLCTVFYTLLIAGAADTRTVPAPIAAGVALCAIVNILMVSTAIQKQSRLVGDVAYSGPKTALGELAESGGTRDVHIHGTHATLHNPALGLGSMLPLSTAVVPQSRDRVPSSNAPSLPVLVVPEGMRTTSRKLSLDTHRHLDVQAALNHGLASEYGLSVYGVPAAPGLGAHLAHVQPYYQPALAAGLAMERHSDMHEGPADASPQSADRTTDEMGDRDDHPLVRLHRVRLMMEGVPGGPSEFTGGVPVPPVQGIAALQEAAVQEREGGKGAPEGGSSYRSESTY